MSRVELPSTRNTSVHSADFVVFLQLSIFSVRQD